MRGEYQFIRNGVLETVHDWDEIPEDFDNLISFKPHFEEGVAHTEEDHANLAKLNDKLQELMEKERARSNQNR